MAARPASSQTRVPGVSTDRAIEQATVERANSSRKGVARGTLRRFSNSSSETAIVRTVSRPSTIRARDTVLTGSWPAGR